ncbi:unnamed protein product [Mytilus edulis]|uniref:Vitellogenin domain-containing protein n=1 Tax=Mytilus edulis TaxID=6550 RepID=A0A8S3TJV1_MYTED|nr:unnamed protein product [Mytilus edulis]
MVSGNSAKNICILSNNSCRFSFEITQRGEILSVYHPPEDSEILAIKKGFAAVFSSKLHSKEEITGKSIDLKSWEYFTEEVGNEGPHSAVYKVKETPVGIAFKKQRRGHVIPNAKGTLTKVLHFHNKLGIIHKVMIEEDFSLPRSTESSDPFVNMRKVKFVNDFDKMSIPEMSALCKGELVFVTRHEVKELYVKPKNVSTGSIRTDKYERTRKGHVNVTEILNDISSNITCIRNQPPKGSTLVNDCFFRIISSLKLLQDDDITKIANDYFQHQKENNETHFETTAIMVDAFAVLNTNTSQQLIVTLILLAPKPDYRLLQRFFIHVSGMEKPPHQSITQVLEDIVFHHGRFTNASYDQNIYNCAMLTLGSVAHKLSKNGLTKKAIEISGKINQKLGLHDPWVYRNKRSLQSEGEQIKYDHRRVILLEALGNARIDHSFDYIISHINSTNSPWIKRAGVHALRKYEHKSAADALLKAALFDDDHNVRYEALLQYQAHPNSSVIQPLDNRYAGNNSETVDPYSSDIKLISLHPRTKRGFIDKFMKGFSFKIEPPGVNWKKVLGSKAVGASFGIIIENYIHLKAGRCIN